MESGERSSAGQPEPRAASAFAAAHTLRGPRGVCHLPLLPCVPDPPAVSPPQSLSSRSPEVTGPRLRSIGPRTASTPSSSSFPSRHRGPLTDARGPAPLFAPRLLLPISSSSSNFSNSLAPLTRPRLRSSRPAPATLRPVPKVGTRQSCPHHGKVRLARPSLRPGRAQRRAPGCRAQVEKLLGSAASLRVKRLQQERCSYA